MKLSRRQFIKLAASIPFLGIAQFAPLPKPPEKAAEPQAQGWHFPACLSTMYFVKMSHREQAAHKVFLPAVSK